MGDDYREEQLYDTIQDLENENTTLKEAVDDLMDENERLRREIKELKNEEGGELIED